MLRTATVLLLLVTTLAACSQYRMASLQDVEIPNYEPRPVAVPASCEAIIARAAESSRRSAGLWMVAPCSRSPRATG